MDEFYMKRALSLAERGRGMTGTNPMVGAVLVKDGEIIGEGWHHGFGDDHAEVNCLKNAKGSPSEATIYVNLEPCSHYGKTPPCVKTIMNAGITPCGGGHIGSESPCGRAWGAHFKTGRHRSRGRCSGRGMPQVEPCFFLQYFEADTLYYGEIRHHYRR